MTFQFLKTCVLASLLLVLLFWANIGYGKRAEIMIVGGTSASGTLKMLAAAFVKSHPGISVQVSSLSDNSGTIKAVLAGAADIGLMSKPLQGKESTLGVISIEYARTPLAFIAGPGVDLTGVTINDVVKIYRGETTTWSNGKPIHLILQPAYDNDTALLRRLSQDMSQAVDIAFARPGIVIAISTQDEYDTVKNVPGSFGFCSLTKVLTEKGSVKILSLNGVFPTTANVNSGSYSFFKPLYMIFKTNASHEVTEFLKFVDSPVAAKLIEKTGGVPVSTRRNVQK